MIQLKEVKRLLKALLPTKLLFKSILTKTISIFVLTDLGCQETRTLQGFSQVNIHKRELPLKFNLLIVASMLPTLKVLQIQSWMLKILWICIRLKEILPNNLRTNQLSPENPKSLENQLLKSVLELIIHSILLRKLPQLHHLKWAWIFLLYTNTTPNLNKGKMN